MTADLPPVDLASASPFVAAAAFDVAEATGTRVTGTVETGAFPMDPQAKLNTADLEQQVAWLKEQKLIDPGVNVPDIVDTSLGVTP